MNKSLVLRARGPSKASCMKIDTNWNEVGYCIKEMAQSVGPAHPKASSLLAEQEVTLTQASSTGTLRNASGEYARRWTEVQSFLSSRRPLSSTFLSTIQSKLLSTYDEILLRLF